MSRSSHKSGLPDRNLNVRVPICVWACRLCIVVMCGSGSSGNECSCIVYVSVCAGLCSFVGTGAHDRATWNDSVPRATVLQFRWGGLAQATTAADFVAVYSVWYSRYRFCKLSYTRCYVRTKKLVRFYEVVVFLLSVTNAFPNQLNSSNSQRNVL